MSNWSDPKNFESDATGRFRSDPELQDVPGNPARAYVWRTLRKVTLTWTQVMLDDANERRMWGRDVARLDLGAVGDDSGIARSWEYLKWLNRLYRLQRFNRAYGGSGPIAQWDTAHRYMQWLATDLIERWRKAGYSVLLIHDSIVVEQVRER